MRWLIAALIMTPVVASAQDSFQLPSGNIFCAVEANAIRCDLAEFSFARPPQPRGCEQDWGHAYALGARGASQVLCAGDTVANPGAPVLGYGARWEGLGVTCLSAPTGLRCFNGEGRGFELSRSRLNRF